MQHPCNPRCCEKDAPLEKPEDLRKLAEWYRGMAGVGHSDDCGWRLRFADYLERRASDMEALALIAPE
jgi:hypothetical protein